MTRQGMTRAEAEADFWRDYDQRARIGYAEQCRREAQENGTFGVSEPPKTIKPSPASQPETVDIPDDFDLPDKEDISGGQVVRCALKWGIGGCKQNIYYHLAKRRQDESPTDSGLPYLLDRKKAIEFLKTLRSTQKQSKKQSN